MPDDSEDLTVRLQRNDFSTSDEEFVLKADKVDRNMSNSLVTKSVLSAAGDIAGKDADLGTESYTVNGYIRNTDADTYPSYVNIDTGQWDPATEKEMNMAQAMRAWGPDTSDGFDDLVWGPRTISGMMSKYTASENTGQSAPEQYDITVEWTHVTIFIGD